MPRCNWAIGITQQASVIAGKGNVEAANRDRLFLFCSAPSMPKNAVIGERQVSG
jgi:hypothetical protein